MAVDRRPRQGVGRHGTADLQCNVSTSGFGMAGARGTQLTRIQHWTGALYTAQSAIMAFLLAQYKTRPPSQPRHDIERMSKHYAAGLGRIQLTHNSLRILHTITHQQSTGQQPPIPTPTRPQGVRAEGSRTPLSRAPLTQSVWSETVPTIPTIQPQSTRHQILRSQLWKGRTHQNPTSRKVPII